MWSPFVSTVAEQLLSLKKALWKCNCGFVPFGAAEPFPGNGYAGLALRTTRGSLKDLPSLRTNIHRQLFTEVKTFPFYDNRALIGGTYASRAILGICVSWGFVALRFSKLCHTKPLLLLLGTRRTPMIQTRLWIPIQSANPTQYPHRRPATLISCPPMDSVGDGRQKPGS